MISFKEPDIADAVRMSQNVPVSIMDVTKVVGRRIFCGIHYILAKHDFGSWIYSLLPVFSLMGFSNQMKRDSF